MTTQQGPLTQKRTLHRRTHLLRLFALVAAITSIAYFCYIQPYRSTLPEIPIEQAHP